MTILVNSVPQIQRTIRTVSTTLAVSSQLQLITVSGYHGYITQTVSSHHGYITDNNKWLSWFYHTDNSKWSPWFYHTDNSKWSPWFYHTDNSKWSPWLYHTELKLCQYRDRHSDQFSEKVQVQVQLKLQRGNFHIICESILSLTLSTVLVKLCVNKPLIRRIYG